MLGIKATAGALVKEITGLYKELVREIAKANAQYEELRKSIDDIRSSLEKLKDELSNHEKDCIKTTTCISSKCDSLRNQLDIVSKQALLIVMENMLNTGGVSTNN
jgi:predicted  nucleic acid-binding Zn-ribbon protein